MRSKWFSVFAVLLAVQGAAAPSSAQALRPHETFNPAKAQSLPMSPLTIVSGDKTNTFMVELADTPEERNIGLMHRNVLAPDHGMLFNFFVEQREQFWMRNTFIPLDLVFINDDGSIEAILGGIPHDERPVGPRAPIMAVLELAAGTAQRLGIKRGDVVHHAIFEH